MTNANSLETPRGHTADDLHILEDEAAKTGIIDDMMRGRIPATYRDFLHAARLGKQYADQLLSGI